MNITRKIREDNGKILVSLIVAIWLVLPPNYAFYQSTIFQITTIIGTFLFMYAFFWFVERILGLLKKIVRSII